MKKTLHKLAAIVLCMAVLAGSLSFFRGHVTAAGEGGQGQQGEETPQTQQAENTEGTQEEEAVQSTGNVDIAAPYAI